jgi:hypothetical protein
MEFKSKQPATARLAFWIAAGFAITELFLLLGQGEGIPFFGFFFPLWIGLPFWFLSRAKVFRAFPMTVGFLLLAGVLLTFWAFWQTFVRPTGSTAALVMFFIPFYLLIAYALSWVVLAYIKEQSL